MAWNLSIETIDVEQGESSFIKAWTDDGANIRTMLIDGGLGKKASIVHNNVMNSIRNLKAAMNMLGQIRIDGIVISHFDADHSGGILKILKADNFCKLCEIITGHVVQSISAYNHQSSRLHIITTATAACTAVIRGAYNDLNGNDYTYLINDACQRAVNQVNQTPGCSDQQALDIGLWAEREVINNNPHNPEFATPQKARTVSIAVADTALKTLGSQQNPALPIFNSIWNNLIGYFTSASDVPVTECIYNQTPVYAIFGNSDLESEATRIINGELLASGRAVWAKVPGINRTFAPNVIPPLGTEILWNEAYHPANGPEMFVLAANAFVWNAPYGTVPIAMGFDNNNLSFGLVLRFNNFFFYTGGDLPSAGENLIVDAVRRHGLPNPAGGNYLTTNQITAFKCGHHGANTCTSDHFLQHASPRVAVISCGNEDRYEHPNPNVLTRLQKTNMFRFYLTGVSNYTYNTYFTQFDFRGRVAGSDVESGKIIISVSENQTYAPTRFFTVSYYEWNRNQFISENIFY